MRVTDHRWPWIALALLLFAGGMGVIHYLQHGISEDFGIGFSIGAIVSGVVFLTAVGWRRGELRRRY